MIRLEDIKKTYQMGDSEVHALDGVSLHIRPEEFVSIIGPSGSGKSTLMNMIGCLDVPTSGRYWIDGVEGSRMSDNDLADLRNQKIGFIYIDRDNEGNGTYRRIKKDSFYWYKKVIATNGTELS